MANHMSNNRRHLEIRGLQICNTIVFASSSAINLHILQRLAGFASQGVEYRVTALQLSNLKHNDIINRGFQNISSLLPEFLESFLNGCAAK